MYQLFEDCFSVFYFLTQSSNYFHSAYALFQAQEIVAENIDGSILDEKAVATSSTLSWEHHHFRIGHCSLIIHLLQYVECFCRQFPKYWQNMISHCSLNVISAFDKRERLLFTYTSCLGKTLYYESISSSPHMLLWHGKLAPICSTPRDINTYFTFLS